MITKVKSVQANGTYDSKHGLLYKFEYTFEDGKTISANHKTQNHFNVGDSVEYEIKGTNDYGSWGNVKKAEQQTFKKDDSYTKGIEVGHAVNNAVNLICAGVELPSIQGYKNQEEKIYMYANFVLALSNRLKSEQ